MKNAKVEQTKPFEQPIVRKVWQTGKGAKTGHGSFVVALPSSWSKRLSSKEVTFTEFKGGLFLSPGGGKKAKIAELKFKGTDPDFIKYQIISSYLNNFREIYIELEKPSKECIEMIGSLPKKLLGVTPSFAEGDNTRLISMSSFLTPIPKVLDRMFALSQRIHRLNQKVMSGAKRSEVEIKADMQNAEAMEDDIDRNSFLIKRFCCVAADEPNLAGRVGIDDLAKMIHWENLNSNLERVGDLQFEIYRELDRLRKEKGEKTLALILSNKDGYSFIDYHKAAQKMVEDAYSNEVKKIAEIISTKRPDEEANTVPFRGKYITKKQRVALERTVSDNRAQVDLTCLNFRIWGITGCSTNIAEAWLNMSGPRDS